MEQATTMKFGSETAEQNSGSVYFNVTSDAWINNGLIALAQTISNMEEFNDKLNISYSQQNAVFSGDKETIFNAISSALHYLAAKGTYNFSTAFKIINKETGSSYAPPNQYPTEKGESKKKTEILDTEREILKRKKLDNSKKQKIWKMRMSFFGSEDNYLKIGLKLENTKDFEKLKLDGTKMKKYVCPICGTQTSSLIGVKQVFNPLSNEHHNNVLDGFSSDMRKNAKACPRCTLLSYFSLFDYYIPFFYTGKETYLAVPNTSNLEILWTIRNNLSLNGQYIDFSDPNCTSYSHNIKSLIHPSKSASMLSLLHNIKNRYSEKTPTQLPTSPFIPIEKGRFLDVIEWLFISKGSHHITHIRANERIYEILDPIEVDGTEFYLVPDVLSKINFNSFDENNLERFYWGILKLNSKEIAYGLFTISKQSCSKADSISLRYAHRKYSPLKLLEEVFLDRIMEASTMLDENLRKACKEVAKSIGRGFSKDVGMMTKFAYASTPDDFRAAISDASFRLAKMTALDSDKNYWIDEKSLSILLDSLKKERYQDIKNYFVSFMSVYALMENYTKKKEGGN